MAKRSSAGLGLPSAALSLTQHRIFVRTFLFGVTVPSQDPNANPVLPLIAGIPDVLERVAGFVGVVVGAELRRTRAVGHAIEAIDWNAADDCEPPDPSPYWFIFRFGE